MNTTALLLATETADLGVVPAATACKRAQAHANETGKPVTVRDPVSDRVIATIKPVKKAAKAKPAAEAKAKAKPARAKAKAKATAKAAKPAKAKATATKPKAEAATTDKAERRPRGRVAEILKLASRKNGVSPAELNALTFWKGAPWRWLLANPKGTGYADRWSFRLRVAKVEGETRYCVTAK